MEGRVAGLGTVNAGGDPCHGQQLPSALCFSSETLEVGFCMRAV